MEESDVCEEDGDRTLVGNWEPAELTGSASIFVRELVTTRPATPRTLVGCGHTTACDPIPSLETISNSDSLQA